MATDMLTSNVVAAKPYGGGIYWAPKGTALPTDTSTALAAAYLPLGYISSDGIQPEHSAASTNITAFGGDIVAVLDGENNRAFSYTLIEVFSANVNKFIFGTAQVTATAKVAGTSNSKLAVTDKAEPCEDGVLVFDLKHGAKRRRIVLPSPKSVITGEGPFQDTALQSYSVTSTAIKDSSGVRVYDYSEQDDK